MKRKLLIIISAIWLFTSHFPMLCPAQSRILTIRGAANIPGINSRDTLKTVKDSLEIISSLKSLRQKIVSAGYLTAGVDEYNFGRDTVYIYLDPGAKYIWADLRPGNVPEEYLTAINYREKIYRHEPLSPVRLSRLFEKIIRRAENNGYPFAEIFLDSLEFRNETISATLHLDRHQLTILDSLIIKGEPTANRRYIQNYLGLKDNIPYDQSLLDKIPARLRELPFIQSIKPYEVGIRPGKADVYLYIKPKPASNFNGILGIQPDNQTGKTQLTGDIELNLLNSLRRGEHILLKWQRLQTRTQELNLGFAYPFLFNTPIGTDLKFNLYRQDTLFSQINAQLGFTWFIRGANTLDVFYENHQANVISAEVFSLENYIDSRTNMFGIGLHLSELNYRLNPVKGYFAEIAASAGSRKIIKNPKVDEAEYADLELNSDIYRLKLKAGIYIPFLTRSTVLLRGRIASILNDQLFQNEIFRIGGLMTLRGFDEQSIYASSYAIGTLEYRFILEENSNFFLFFDQAIYENRSSDKLTRDHPFGFGAGINFETKPGIFSFTYALGKQFDNPILFRNSKIHFGFISFF